MEAKAARKAQLQTDPAEVIRERIMMKVFANLELVATSSNRILITDMPAEVALRHTVDSAQASLVSNMTTRLAQIHLHERHLLRHLHDLQVQCPCSTAISHRQGSTQVSLFLHLRHLLLAHNSKPSYQNGVR